MKSSSRYMFGLPAFCSISFCSVLLTSGISSIIASRNVFLISSTSSLFKLIPQLEVIGVGIYKLIYANYANIVELTS